jgi:hypothetical protein
MATRKLKQLRDELFGCFAQSDVSDEKLQQEAVLCQRYASDVERFLARRRLDR